MSGTTQLTIAQLRAFSTAARTQSFTAAAARMGIAQASISELVRRLEQEYRLVLFTRGGRRLTLTSAGQLLLPIAERAIDSIEQADAALRDFAGLHGGVASFGVMRNAEYYLLTELAQTFNARHPDLRVRLIGQNSVDVAAAVMAGELEAGVVVLPVNVEGLDVRPLLRDEVVLATADPHRYGDEVTPDALATAPLIFYDAHYGEKEPTRRQVLDWAANGNTLLTPAIEVEHVTSALDLVSRGVGDTFVSRAVTRAAHFPRNISLASFSPPIYDTVASITRDAGALSPASRQLLELAEQILVAQATRQPSHEIGG